MRLGVWRLDCDESFCAAEGCLYLSLLLSLPEQVEVKLHFGLRAHDPWLGPIQLSCLLKRLPNLNDVIGQPYVRSFM